MEQLDFMLYQKNNLPQGKEVVLLQAGKGKHKDGSVYMLAQEFTYVEGIIWDKHREYGNNSKTKINSEDWTRIVSGFKDAENEVPLCKRKEDLNEVLQLRNHKDSTLLEQLFVQRDEYLKLLQELTNWITTQTKKEKYILIIKK